MSFGSPWFLLGLLLIPLLAAHYVRGERSRRAFAPAALMPAVAPHRAGWRRHAPMAGYGLAIAALLVALARPQATVAVPAEQATVVVVTDRSGSMLATDVAPSRLVAARRAAETFLDAVPREVRVGAIAFNHAPQVVATPTRDHEAVREALTSVGAAGSTATGDALHAAAQLIQGARRPGARKPPPAAIVLISDGKSVRGRDVMDAAEELRRARVPVYTIALGTATGTIESRTRSGALRQVPVPPDPETLQRVADRTGGRAFAADDADRLHEIHERLGREVATERRRREVTGLFAGGALLLVAGAAAASLRWFGRFV